ncbi:O-antigen ligase family protein [Tolumonas osonensis]|uniref:O-antigen ligase n=1 Tax=Tolumonas osonensis TaxID=675874 RepID=A0A841GLM4_9GAMM|nr:O-antigen ligase family protein [Tolumonas osonensis]MBB6056041.1 O-antigen ligase [Tolumonas osonensis]
MICKSRSKLFKLLLTLFSFLGLFLSSSGFEVFKAGGARPENIEYSIEPYEGVLNYMTPLWVMLGIVLFILFICNLKFSVYRLNKFFLFLALLVFYLFLSVSWSIYPKTSLNNAVLILCFALFSFMHVWVSGTRRAIMDIEHFLFFVVLLSYFMVFFMPTYGLAVGRHEGFWQGVFSHKNNLGVTCNMALVFFLINKNVCSILYWSKLVLVFFLLIMSGSYTAIFTAFLILFFFAAMKIKLSKNIIMFAVFSILFFGFFAVFISQSGLGFNIFGKGTDFSSRNLIWGFVINRFLERPILGYGLATFQELAKQEHEIIRLYVGEVVNNTHNGFLDSLLNLGMIGFSLSLIFLFITPYLNRTSGCFNVSVLMCLVFIVNNSFESRFFVFGHLLYVYFYCFFIGVKSRINKKKLQVDNNV